MPTIDLELPTALFSCLALGALLGLTGCPAQSACPPCFVGGVLAPDNRPNPTPNATVNLQLGSNLKRQGKVTEVQITLTDVNGSSETVRYGADQVGSLDSSSMLTISDNEVYSVNDQAPRTATVEIVFANGHRATDTIDIRTE